MWHALPFESSQNRRIAESRVDEDDEIYISVEINSALNAGIPYFCLTWGGSQP
jgi:hypothetical protein